MMFKSIVEESSELSDNGGVVHNTIVPNLTCLPALLYLLQILSQSTCESRYCLFIISHE